MENFSPTIITSKAADKDLLKIKAAHADILQGMQDQSTRVDAYKSEQKMNKQTLDETNQKHGMESEKMRMEMETKKMAEENKAKELAIKEMALASTD